MFVPVEKGKFTGDFPQGVVRITSKRVMISPDISEKFQAVREQKLGDGGTMYEKVNLALAIDLTANQIKLTPSKDGFGFFASNSKILYGQRPTALVRSGLPIGDYVLTDAEHNIFTLAQ